VSHRVSLEGADLYHLANLGDCMVRRDCDVSDGHQLRCSWLSRSDAHAALGVDFGNGIRCGCLKLELQDVAP